MVWLNRPSLYCTFTGLIACLLSAQPLLAQQDTVIFHGEFGDGHSWTDAGNWNPGVPDSTSDVLIDLPGATVDVDVYLPSGTTPITIKSLTLGHSTDTVAGVTLVNANISSRGFVLHVTGDVTIEADGVLDMQGSTMGGYRDSLFVGGAITNNGTIIINKGSYIQGSITNNDTLKSTNTGLYAKKNTVDGTITNDSSGCIVLSPDVDEIVSELAITGDLNNAGCIKFYGDRAGGHSAILLVTGTLTNQVGATIHDSSGTSTSYHSLYTSALVNNGVIIFNSLSRAYDANTPANPFQIGSTTGSLSVTNTGTIRVGHRVKVSGITTFTNTGTITLDSTGLGHSVLPSLALAGSSGTGTLVTDDKEIHGWGTLELDGMDLNLTREFVESDSLSLSLANGSALTLTTPLTIVNSLSISGGSNVTASSITNDGTLLLIDGTITGAITNNDTLSAELGSITDDVVNNVGGRMNVAWATLDSNLDNAGSLTWSGGTVSGIVTNETTGVLTTSGGIIATTKLDNLGIWNSTVQTVISAKVNNGATGTLAISGGDFYVSNGDTLVNSGIITIDTTISLKVSGGYYLGEGGTLDGKGIFSLTDSSVSYLGDKFVHRDGSILLEMRNSELHVDSLINQRTLVAEYQWFDPGAIHSATSNTIYVDSVLINQGHLTLHMTDVIGTIINEDTLVIEVQGTFDGPIINDVGGVADCIKHRELWQLLQDKQWHS